MCKIPPSKIECVLRGRLEQERAYQNGLTCVLGWAFTSMVPHGELKARVINAVSWFDDHHCDEDC